jgi:hypothetical protein
MGARTSLSDDWGNQNHRDSGCRNKSGNVIHRPNETLLAVAKYFILSRFKLPAEASIEKINLMKITKNIGMLLLAVYLIIDGLLGFGLNMGPAIFLLYLVALAAGIFILIGK